MKIYTVTYYKGNYGSALQAYALQKKIVELGANAKIIEPPIVNEHQKYTLKKRIFSFFKPERHYGVMLKIRRIIEQRLFKQKNIKINDFVNNNLQRIPYKDFCDQLEDDDVLLSGSDQIWSIINGNIKDFYLFKTIDNNKVLRVSYAASIGVSNLTTTEIKYYKKELVDYDVVSLREKNAYNQLYNKLGEIHVRQDIDPTLLYDKFFWNKLIKKKNIGKKYIFVYMLRPDKKLIRMAKKLAKINNQMIIYMGQFNNFYPNVKTITDAGVEDFLSTIYYADAIITNSFHGTVFSILFEKKFVSVKIESTSSRVESLLSMVGLENHLIEKESDLDIISENIDFAKVSMKLTQYRKESIKYITDVICKHNQKVMK